MSSGFIRTLVGGFSELQTILYESTLPSASTSASSSDGATRSGVVLVQLSAKWCGPCRRIKPVVEELAAIHSDVDFVYIDAEETDENRELTQQLGVRGFPTFILYEAGNKKEEFSGADAARLTGVCTRHSLYFKRVSTYLFAWCECMCEGKVRVYDWNAWCDGASAWYMVLQPA